jgi:hypothetical protein
MTYDVEGRLLIGKLLRLNLDWLYVVTVNAYRERALNYLDRDYQALIPIFGEKYAFDSVHGTATYPNPLPYFQKWMGAARSGLR